MRAELRAVPRTFMLYRSAQETPAIPHLSERIIFMLRLRKWILPVLGMASVALAGVSAWKADAQGGVSVSLKSLTPRRVDSGGQANIVVKVTGTGITGVFARTLATSGVTASSPSALVAGANNLWAGSVTAGVNTARAAKSVNVQVTVQRGSQRPATANVGTLTVNPGTSNPNEPPRPPPI